MFIGVIIVSIIALITLVAFVFISEQMSYDEIDKMERDLRSNANQCMGLLPDYPDNDFSIADKCYAEFKEDAKKLSLAKIEKGGFTQYQIEQSQLFAEKSYQNRMDEFHLHEFYDDAVEFCGTNLEKCGDSPNFHADILASNWMSCYNHHSEDGEYSFEESVLCFEHALMKINVDCGDECDYSASGFNP